MAVAAILAALLLPLAPHPSPPFPVIITDSVQRYDVAPGIAYGGYTMRTADGPLAVHVLAVDLNDSDVHVNSALAGDRLVSQGETLTSMLDRTGSIAGINADYFDINHTNQPLNLLVQNGIMLRPPMTYPVTRPVLAIARDGIASIGEYTLAESAQFGGRTLTLVPFNDWPPRANAAELVTSSYGALPAASGVILAQLVAQGPVAPFGTYTVGSVIDASAQTTNPAGTYLAFGPQFDAANLPSTGESVQIEADAQPSLAQVQTAVGGGPLLVKNGAWYSDPHGPSSGEFATHMPASAVGITGDGTLLLFEVDGRQPDVSIGVLQPQLAALMIAFGVQTGMQFDGGGSSEMAARLPGDDRAEVVNVPSDGVERHIADALIISSSARGGAPVRIVTRPQAVHALPGAHVSLLAAEVDASGRTVRRWNVPIAAAKPEHAVLRIARDGLQTTVPLIVTAAPATLAIAPQHPVARRGERLQLTARAFDAGGDPVALPPHLAWSARGAQIAPDGILTAGSGDAAVAVRAGGAEARTNVIVGEHQVPIAFTQNDLPYDFTGAHIAAYANVTLPLQSRALGIALDVFGDGNGETLRTAVVTAINERFLYTIARVDWTGWRRVEVRFPLSLPQPLTLRSIYVVGRIGHAPPVTRAGRLMLRDVREIVAGAGGSSSK